MKRTFILLAGICFAATGMAQTDSTTKESDTIRVGEILIIKNKKDKKDDDNDRDDDVRVERRKDYKPKILAIQLLCSTLELLKTLRMGKSRWLSFLQRTLNLVASL